MLQHPGGLSVPTPLPTSTAYAIPQEWTSAHGLAETYRFTLSAEVLAAGKQVLGQAAVTVTEGALLEILGSDMSVEQQRKKIDKWTKKLPKFAKSYELDVKKQVLPRIISEAVAQSIS